jgi:hypothetical protein
VRLQSITEEIVPHTTGTIIRKACKNGTLNGKITSYDKEREYYMIEYDDGDSEELRHKTVERYIVTANTAIDQLQKLTAFLFWHQYWRHFWGSGHISLNNQT